MARKAISKKVRFEVFKRDNFTCQYCGKKAPDVILHIDHINPVSKGGDNSIINLVTSCECCNSGKSDVVLSDDSAIQRQRQQLEQLNQRREQLEMMLKWRDGLGELKADEVRAAEAAWNKVGSPFVLNDTGREVVGKLVKKFGLRTVLDSVEVAGERYIKRDTDGKVTEESANLAFNKLGGICGIKNQPEWTQRLYYARGILRRRLTWLNEWRCMDLMRAAVKAGVDPEELVFIAKTAPNFTKWEQAVMEAMGGN